MKLRLWYVCMLIAAYLPAQIQVRGYVRHIETQESLPGVHLSVSGNAGTVTDIDGAFILNVSSPCTLTASSVGFDTYSSVLTILSSDTSIVIYLSPASTLLNQVVVTSSRYGKELGQLVESMDILTADQLAQQNNTSLDDALERVSGVQIIDGQPNIRGGSGYSYGAGSRVLVLLDNLPILTGDAGYPVWSYIPIEHVEQVEIIKGAASVLYGSSALNGVINLRTAYPGQQPETKASVFGGLYSAPVDSSQHWWSGSQRPWFSGVEVSHRQRLGRLDLVVGGYGYAEDSYLENDYQRRGRLSINTRYRTSTEGLTYGLNANMMSNKSSSFFLWQNAEAGAFQPLPNTMAQNKGFRFNVDPHLQWIRRGQTIHRLQGRYYYSDNQTDTEQSTTSTLLYGEYQLTHPVEKLGVTLAGGLTATYIHTIAELYGDTTHTAGNGAMYLQAEKRWGERVTLIAGGRLERNRINDLEAEWRPVGRLGINYKAGAATYLRGSAGQGYRYPTIAEQHVRTNIGLISIFPNPDLQSETGYSVEAGIKQGLKVGNWKGFADLALFHTAYQNMMEFSFGGVDGSLFGFQSINVGDTRINGVEITLAGQGELGPLPLQLMAGYVYIDPTYADFTDNIDQYSSADYNVLKYRFRHTGTWQCQTGFEKLNVGVAARYYSRMEAIDFVFEQLIAGVKDYRDNQPAGDWVWDVNADLSVGKHITISAIARNLLNRTYSLRPGIMEPTRSWVLRVAFKG